jgi:hypothetical protein
MNRKPLPGVIFSAILVFVSVRALADDLTPRAYLPLIRKQCNLEGDELAFVSHRDGNYEIYLMQAHCTGITNLTNNPGQDEFPNWSPDGSKIAFVSDRDGNSEIYVMNADGTDQINVSNDPEQKRSIA